MKLVEILRLDCTRFYTRWVGLSDKIQGYCMWDKWGDGSDVEESPVGLAKITGEIRSGDLTGAKGTQVWR